MLEMTFFRIAFIKLYVYEKTLKYVYLTFFLFFSYYRCILCHTKKQMTQTYTNSYCIIHGFTIIPFNKYILLYYFNIYIKVNIVIRTLNEYPILKSLLFNQILYNIYISVN